MERQHEAVEEWEADQALYLVGCVSARILGEEGLRDQGVVREDGGFGEAACAAGPEEGGWGGAGGGEGVEGEPVTRRRLEEGG
jgi:hypothetical protein